MLDKLRVKAENLLEESRNTPDYEKYNLIILLNLFI